jgi:hypothetical protein
MLSVRPKSLDLLDWVKLRCVSSLLFLFLLFFIWILDM